MIHVYTGNLLHTQNLSQSQIGSQMIGGWGGLGGGGTARMIHVHTGKTVAHAKSSPKLNQLTNDGKSAAHMIHVYIGKLLHAQNLPHPWVNVCVLGETQKQEQAAGETAVLPPQRR